MEYHKLSEQITSQYSQLLAHLRKRVRNRDLAADLMHDAVTITLEKARGGALTHDERLAGYVLRVSLNLWRNHRRNMDNRSECHLGTDALRNVAAPDNRYHDERQSASLHGAIEAMGTRDQAIITRLYLAEDGKQAICKDLGLSSSSFDMIAARARRRLRDRMERVQDNLESGTRSLQLAPHA